MLETAKYCTRERRKKLSHKYSVDSIPKFRFMNHFCPKSTFPILLEQSIFRLNEVIGCCC